MTRFAPSAVFMLASLLPGACLLAGAFLGGVWSAAGLITMTLVVFLCDRASFAARAGPGLAKVQPLLIAGLHFTILPAVLLAIGMPGHLSGAETVLLLLGAGLFFGQVSNACAHELIHRQSRAARRLGAAIYVSLLNGQHVSAHLLVHHVHAGTDKDPNSAPLGQSFWQFAARASVTEFAAGWRAETARQRPGQLHPYAIWLGGAAFTLVTAGLLAGVAGIAALIAMSVYAQLQLLLSDYLQHYGLRRRRVAGGRTEPMGPQHSWNAPQPWSAALMLNAPLHSDHHMHPGRSFDQLYLDPDRAPVLPRSVPVMGALAFVPPLWRRVMDPRVRRLTGEMPRSSEPDTRPSASTETLSI
ncbi:alkane 1-monooxygenase [Roseobacter ponti]|uniref:Alkane 1-monooxygenase n=1 Tax=Roseobacter ponti TaxID=1891787 RepID=A0A858SVL3_9RHOB|nr:alkane 1-monooxygenase [Roseobacter ponti]QJF52037.1 alkane 1-monooxygenase [Roseobacter ponti]